MEATREIKRVCWENAGIVREGVLLEEAREELEDVEAENMCLSARAVVESALMRTESRGAHYPHGLSRIGRCALAGEHFREKR